MGAGSTRRRPERHSRRRGGADRGAAGRRRRAVRLGRDRGGREPGPEGRASSRRSSPPTRGQYFTGKGYRQRRHHGGPERRASGSASAAARWRCSASTSTATPPTAPGPIPTWSTRRATPTRSTRRPAKSIVKRNSLPQPNLHWGDGLEKDAMTFANFRMPLNASRLERGVRLRRLQPPGGDRQRLLALLRRQPELAGDLPAGLPAGVPPDGRGLLGGRRASAPAPAAGPSTSAAPTA